MRGSPVARLVALSLVLFAVVRLGSVVGAVEKWGPFRGQVVDRETGQPIPGAVVLVVWWRAEQTPIQTNQQFYDAKEAVTDAEGRFEIPRLALPFFTFWIFDPNIDWFAPGYEHAKLVVTPPGGEPFVDPTVIQMRRLKTREELLRKSRGYPSMVPRDKMPLFLRAIEIEDQMIWPGSRSPRGKK